MKNSSQYYHHTPPPLPHPIPHHPLPHLNNIFSFLRFSKTIKKKMQTPSPPQPPSQAAYVDVLNTTALKEFRGGRVGHAIDAMHKALRILHGEGAVSLMNENSSYARCLNNLAFMLKSVKDFDGARRLYERALAVRLRTLGPIHGDVAVSMHNLAALYLTVGKPEAALPLHKREVDIHRVVSGEFSRPYSQSLHDYALCLDICGNHSEAVQVFEAELASLAQRDPNACSPERLQCLQRLASCLESAGKADVAVIFYEQAKEVQRRIDSRKRAGKDADVLRTIVGLHDLVTRTDAGVPGLLGSRYLAAISRQERHGRPDIKLFEDDDDDEGERRVGRKGTAIATTTKSGLKAEDLLSIVIDRPSLHDLKKEVKKKEKEERRKSRRERKEARAARKAAAAVALSSSNNVQNLAAATVESNESGRNNSNNSNNNNVAETAKTTKQGGGGGGGSGWSWLSWKWSGNDETTTTTDEEERKRHSGLSETTTATTISTDLGCSSGSDISSTTSEESDDDSDGDIENNKRVAGRRMPMMSNNSNIGIAGTGIAAAVRRNSGSKPQDNDEEAFAMALLEQLSTRRNNNNNNETSNSNNSKIKQIPPSSSSATAAAAYLPFDSPLRTGRGGRVVSSPSLGEIADLRSRSSSREKKPGLLPPPPPLSLSSAHLLRQGAILDDSSEPPTPVWRVGAPVGLYDQLFCEDIAAEDEGEIRTVVGEFFASKFAAAAAAGENGKRDSGEGKRDSGHILDAVIGEEGEDDEEEFFEAPEELDV